MQRIRPEMTVLLLLSRGHIKSPQFRTQSSTQVKQSDFMSSAPDIMVSTAIFRTVTLQVLKIIMKFDSPCDIILKHFQSLSCSRAPCERLPAYNPEAFGCIPDLPVHAKGMDPQVHFTAFFNDKSHNLHISVYMGQ